MTLNQETKQKIKRQIVSTLSQEREVQRIVIFGSFLTSPAPHDLDVAVFQESSEGYLALALKYRRLVRDVARLIPLDIIPLKACVTDGAFLAEIEKGEVVYER
ncbi:MAG: nucleotidyltransferase domain-containing protein [bacterium]